MNTPVFYDHFERHAHGEGLKGHSTHYCPGCGHGLVHRDLADAGDQVLQELLGNLVFLHFRFLILLFLFQKFLVSLYATDFYGIKFASR